MSTTEEWRNSGFFRRHDPIVLVAAMALFAAGSFAYRVTTTPEVDAFDHHGLAFHIPELAWLPEQHVTPPPLRLLHGVLPAQTRQRERQHTRQISAADPRLSLEILITARPRFSNLRAVRSLARRTRYGELYRELEPQVITTNGKRWLRTRFSYATKPIKHAAPQVATGIELTTLNGRLMYAITAHGDPVSARWLAERIQQSLRVNPNVDGAGTAADQRASTKALAPAPAPDTGPVADASLPATVMVMAVDLIGGRLRPVGGGSGVTITSDGYVLTNYHVLSDERGDRLHDFFVIGRYRPDRAAPELVCAGEPSGGQLEPNRDLALIRCDRNLDGHAWTPRGWPTLPFSLSEKVGIADKVFIFGYPRPTGGTPAVRTGNVVALPGTDQPFIKISAAISDGFSGGPVVEETGRLVGIAAARHEDGGLVIPIGQAVDLIVLTRQLESHRDAPAGVSIAGRLVSMANGRPIANGLALVFKEGIDARDLSFANLHKDIVAWGISDTNGHFVLSRLLPRGSRYTAIFWASGFLATPPRRLRIDPTGPRQLTPWPPIQLGTGTTP